MDWEPIRRGKPDVRGVNPLYEGLLDVDIPLDRVPPPEWARAFQNPTGVGIPVSMHPPELQGASVHIRPPDDELGKYVAHVDERIGHANESYERDALPQLKAAGQRVIADQEEERRRLEEARRKAEEL